MTHRDTRTTRWLVYWRLHFLSAGKVVRTPLTSAVLLVTACLLLPGIVIGEDGALGASLTREVRVLFVIDGDSIVVEDAGRSYEIRLWGIDAPEYNQTFGRDAKKILQDILVTSRIGVLAKDLDKYGRVVARLSSNELEVSAEMVRRGSAWVHDYFCREPVCELWRRLQKQAAAEKRGLWQAAHPVAPWIWKHGPAKKTSNQKPSNTTNRDR